MGSRLVKGMMSLGMSVKTRRLVMTEPKDLLLINEQLRRSNHRWKTLALAACLALVLTALVGFAAISARERRVEAAMRDAAALRAANAAARAANAALTSQPR
jgi:hypothetical protein